MDVIRLKKMLFYGYHGVSKSEKELGGKFEVDVELHCPLNKAGKSDLLKDTIDYETVYKIVDTCSHSKKYFLIEALAETICRSLIDHFPVKKVKVCVRKPNAPVKGVLDYVEIELNRKNHEY
jgi:dihydroneopterin aldolase